MEATTAYQIHFARDTRGRALPYSWHHLVRRYPKLAAVQGDSPVLSLLAEVFPEGLPKQVIFSNRSYAAERGTMKRIGIRPVVYQDADDPLFRLLGPEKTLLLLGQPMGKSFLLHAVQVVENAEALPEEMTAIIIRRKQEDIAWNALDGLLEKIPSLADDIRRQVADWMAYPVWERDIELRLMAGCRFVHWRVERFSSRQGTWQLVFTVTAESQEAFEQASRNFRQDASAASLQVSKHPWMFQFIGPEELRKRRSATPIPLGRAYVARELSFADDRRIQRAYSVPFPEPYIAELPVSLPDSWQRDADACADNEEVEDVLRGKGLPEQGFLMRSTATLTLMNRLIYEAQRFEEGNCASLNLAQVLFDAKNARLPQRHAAITSWQNEDIAKNENQRAAVQKMLDAPDLCLIQGPPGTGKTTVIAESIYQSVHHGERVLLSSQSNDAVDNALDRLPLTPDIRPLRIQNEQRSHDEGALTLCTEDHVLHRFYQSLAKGVKSSCLQPWQAQDEELAAARQALRDWKLHTSNLAPLRQREQKLHDEEHATEERLRACQQHLADAREEQALCRAEARNRNLLQAACSSERYVSFSLSLRQMRTILPLLNRILAEGAAQGILFLKGRREIPEASLHRELDAPAVFLWNFHTLRGIAARAREAASGPSADARLPELEQKRAQLLANVPDPSDSAAVSAWQSAFFAVSREFQQAEASGQFVLREDERSLLSESLAAAAHEDVRHFSAVLDAFLPQAEAAWDEIVQQLCQNIPAEPELAPLQRDVQAAENGLASLHAEHMSVQTRIQQEAQALEALGTKEAIEARCRKAQAAIDEVKSIRTIWEPILWEYHRMLLDKTTAQQDSEAGASDYLQIYKDSCNVVGATCTANQQAGDQLGLYDVAIIDEVSKTTPIELLIPMRRARRSVLVGDHRQLPPQFRHHENEPVFDEAADGEDTTAPKASYEKFRRMVGHSIFKDAFTCADASIKHSLLTQYRMHPDIMDVVNVFYDHRLTCGFPREVADQRMDAGLTVFGEDHSAFVTPQHHACWIDSGRLPDGTRVFEDPLPEGIGNSAKNTMEQIEIVELVKKLAAACRLAKTKKTLGIICFYRQQVREIKKRLRDIRKAGTCDLSYLSYTVNTVDRFQGQERNIIICSLTRSKPNPEKISTFVKAFERINVAFSRAQQLLFIVGAAETYREIAVPLPRLDAEGTITTKVYGSILQHLEEQGCVFPSSRLIGRRALEQLQKELQTRKGRLSA